MKKEKHAPNGDIRLIIRHFGTDAHNKKESNWHIHYNRDIHFRIFERLQPFFTPCFSIPTRVILTFNIAHVMNNNIFNDLFWLEWRRDICVIRLLGTCVFSLCACLLLHFPPPTPTISRAAQRSVNGYAQEYTSVLYTVLYG